MSGAEKNYMQICLIDAPYYDISVLLNMLSFRKVPLRNWLGRELSADHAEFDVGQGERAAYVKDLKDKIIKYTDNDATILETNEESLQNIMLSNSKICKSQAEVFLKDANFIPVFCSIEEWMNKHSDKPPKQVTDQTNQAEQADQTNTCSPAKNLSSSQIKEKLKIYKPDRENDLFSVIQKAMLEVENPTSYSSVWLKICEYAEKDKPPTPLTHYKCSATNGEIKIIDCDSDNGIKIITKKGLRSRQNRILNKLLE